MYILLQHFLFSFYRLESSKSYAEIATPPAKNRQQQHYSQQQQQQPQRLSPFDELMAQHQQQLQRERQLLRLASARGQQQRSSAGVAVAPAGATISEAAEVTSGSGKLSSSTIPPPIPIKTSKLEDIIHTLAEPPFEYSTPARSELPKKSLSETTADVKRGLLSSILEKVRSKEEQQNAMMAAEAAKSGGPGTVS